MIQAIDKGVVHRICSGQVILDLATAVKELVENALDAGATTVEEHGSELIEIADNGSGVDPANYQSLTLKYHTSKLQRFSDLQAMSTFGFRGEALSSLCALASVSVTTRTANTNPAQRLTYDHTGALVGTAPTARAVGSTVAVKDLFKTLPVRHKVQPGVLETCQTRVCKACDCTPSLCTHLDRRPHDLHKSGGHGSTQHCTVQHRGQDHERQHCQCVWIQAG
ncbi:hypothetical protein ABBQ32_003597 [Trebouxia sp. C0010 RCD-2024]